MHEPEDYVLLELGVKILATDEVIGYDDTTWHRVPNHLIGREVWSDWRQVGNLKFRRQHCPQHEN